MVRGHLRDPATAAAYRIIKALRSDALARHCWQQLAGVPLRAKPQGPRRTYLITLERIGLQEENPWTLQDTRGNRLCFLDEEWPKVKEFVKSSLRDYLLSQAEKRRKRFAGITQSDPKLTGKYLRIPNVTRKKEAISILCDALWTNRRKCQAGQREDSKCDWCGAEVEDPERVFYTCPRWEGCRHYVRQYTDHLAPMPSGARQCGHAPRDVPPELRKDWPLLLDELAHIWSQRIQMAEMLSPTEDSNERHQTGSTTSPPALPVGGGVPLDFEIPTQLSGGFRPWPCSKTAWHKTLKLLTHVRRPESGEEEARPTVLELYLQYLQLYGEPFEDGLRHDGKDGGLGVQLASFTSALRSAEARLGIVLLQKGKQSQQVRATWGAQYGFPPLPCLGVPLIMPEARQIWDLIGDASMQMLQEMETDAPKGAAPWRRWRPAIKGGCIHPFPDAPPGEFELQHIGQAFPEWARTLRRDTIWMATFRTFPEAQTLLPWGETVGDYVGKGAFRTAAGFKGAIHHFRCIMKRADMLCKHNEKARTNGWHMIADSWSTRATCYMCGEVGFSYSARWMERVCEHVEPRDSSRETRDESYNAMQAQLHLATQHCQKAMKLFKEAAFAANRIQ